MIRQTEYEIFVKANPVELVFREIGADADAPFFSLQDLNAKGARLTLVFETKDDIQEIRRRIAIFDWEKL